MIEIAAVLKL